MADKCYMCLLGLIILCPLLTDMNGTEVTHVFCSFGKNVHLPCKNVLSDCTSTTWNYDRLSGAVELIAGGKKKNDIERHERLSLSSDCSLNIKKVTEEDYGFYTCQQFVNGGQKGTDARVYLHVLNVSSLSSQTKIRPGSSVTLSCQLYYDRVSCETLVRSEGIQLIWVNQAGVNLQTDSRYQISSRHCNSTLTTTLLNEDHNTEWRCLVTQRNEVKTSITYTVKYPIKTQTVTTVTSSKTTITINTAVTSTQPVSTTLILTTTKNSEKQTRPTPTPTPPDELVSPTVTGIAVVAAALAVLLPAVILWVICKKRADKRRGTNDSVEQKEDVTYTEVATYSKIQAKRYKVNDDDKVTYAAIRGVTIGPQDNGSQVYVSVNKNHHK